MDSITNILILYLLFLGGDYEIEKVCRGQQLQAAVIEHDNLHYVIRSDEFLSYEFDITEMRGLHAGYSAQMEYEYQDVFYYRDVEILSRVEWGYAGEAGAMTVCRTSVKPKF